MSSAHATGMQGYSHSHRIMRLPERAQCSRTKISLLCDSVRVVAGLMTNSGRAALFFSFGARRRRWHVAFQTQIDNDVAVMLVIVRGVEQQDGTATGLRGSIRPGQP